MLKKTITYTDYNDAERTEDFFFNLTQTELIEWEIGVEGGLSETINKIVNTQDPSKLIGYFKELVLRSYGEKSDDGRRFVKSKDISEAFSQTEAFNKLYMELVMDADVAADFINGILPKEYRTEIKEIETIAKPLEEMKTITKALEEN